MGAFSLEVRDVKRADAEELTDLLNAIIVKGGSTALEAPLRSADALADAYLLGPDVHCCFVAVDRAASRIEGFQMLCRYPKLHDPG